MGATVRVLLGVTRDAANGLCPGMQGQPDIDIVGVAHDGRSVLEQVGRLKPDLLLLDLVLPELDGLAVLEQLSEDRTARPRVIVLSSLTSERLVAQANAAGADYYLSKPCAVDVVVDRIRQIAGISRPVQAVAPSVSQNRPPMSDRHADISRLLVEIGVPAHILGYRYLRQAVQMVADRVDILGAVTKELYPPIAQDHGTTPARVERAMRHAIEVAWSRGDTGYLQSIFGNTVNRERGKPTTTEFVALLADKLRLKAS